MRKADAATVGFLEAFTLDYPQSDLPFLNHSDSHRPSAILFASFSKSHLALLAQLRPNLSLLIICLQMNDPERTFGQGQEILTDHWPVHRAEVYTLKKRVFTSILLIRLGNSIDSFDICRLLGSSDQN